MMDGRLAFATPHHSKIPSLRTCLINGTGILPVGLRGIGILPMIHGLEGAPNAAFCVGDPKPMPR